MHVHCWTGARYKGMLADAVLSEQLLRLTAILFVTGFHPRAGSLHSMQLQAIRAVQPASPLALWQPAGRTCCFSSGCRLAGV